MVRVCQSRPRVSQPATITPKGQPSHPRPSPMIPKPTRLQITEASEMEIQDTYDVIVIGGGPAGENVADLAGRTGLRVALVEAELVGGECSYWACMPSKALLRPGEVLDAARRTPGVIGASIDADAALSRRDALASNWDDAGQVDWVESVGAHLIRGRGRLAGAKTVEVEAPDGARRLYAATTAVVIATGTRALVPPIEGLDGAGFWDSRAVTTAKGIPRRLLLVGGGVVGVEMAQAWKALGTEEVTVVEMADRLLPAEEPFVGEELAAQFARDGIRVLTSSQLTRVERKTPEGPVTAWVEPARGVPEILETDELVVAVGRRPNTEDIGLETVGLEPGHYLQVDDRLLVEGVEGEWLYAVGDVTGRSLLTHTGKYQARIAGALIAGNRCTSAWGDVKATPRVVFTHPQVAAVGPTEAQARARGLEVRTVTYETGHVAGSATLGKGYRGTAKLVVDAAREVIVGATFVSPVAGEMLHAATIAIVGEVPLERLWHAIPAFPTVSEVWLRLLETYRDAYERSFD